MLGVYVNNVPVVKTCLLSASSDSFVLRLFGNPPDLCIRGQKIKCGVWAGFGYWRHNTFAQPRL